MSDLPIVLRRAASTPLSRQVADELRRAAADGVIRVGERLPSTRELAGELNVSRTVTSAAYEQLYAEGWITARRGAGTFVAAVPKTPAPARVAPVHDAGPQALVSARTEQPARAEPPARTEQSARAEQPARFRASASLDGDRPDNIDLGPGVPWVAGLQMDAWRRAWRAAASDSPEAHRFTAGVPEYRTAVSEHLLRHRGLAVDGNAVLATSGTTAAVGEFALSVLRPGDAVAVEEPGYRRAVGTLRACGVRVVPAPVDDDGLIVDLLPDGVRAVYCTPAHQYPLGGRLSAARRVALVEWVRARGAWVIEDDYDGELRYDVAPLPVLAAVGPDVVVHLGTTSKILCRTLGVGWMVAPPQVTKAILDYRTATGTGPAMAGQRVLAALASTGDLARHLRRVRRELSARRTLVGSELTDVGLTVLGDRAGAHVVVVLEDTDTERRLVEALHAEGVVVCGLETCYDGPPEVAGILLGYAGPFTREQLERGLGQVVHAVRREP